MIYEALSLAKYTIMNGYMSLLLCLPLALSGPTRWRYRLVTFLPIDSWQINIESCRAGWKQHSVRRGREKGRGAVILASPWYFFPPSHPTRKASIPICPPPYVSLCLSNGGIIITVVVILWDRCLHSCNLSVSLGQWNGFSSRKNLMPKLLKTHPLWRVLSRVVRIDVIQR